MCLAVCSKKMGGCGYIGDDREWSQKEHRWICPVCGRDSMYFLHDYNLEAVVERTMMGRAKAMLDDYYANLRGPSLRIAYKNGNVPSHRLTGARKREIGLA